MDTNLEILFKDGSSKIFKNTRQVRHLNKVPILDAGGLVWKTMLPEWWYEGLIEVTFGDGVKETVSGETVANVIYR